MRKLILCSVVFLLSPVLQADDAFPGRQTYVNVAVIEMEDLHKKFDQVAIIDVRSEYEYKTLHIDNAINVPLSSMKFNKQIKNLRSMGNKPIIFYCNGHTCMKSYKAAVKAESMSIKDVFAFDTGIFDWASKYPNKTMLLGKKLGDASKLIGTDEFKKHQLPPSQFKNMMDINKKSVRVIDVRDRFQRSGSSLFSGNEEWIPLDQENKLTAAIKKAKKDKKTLLIYDEVGKQVRWLQYRIEQLKHKNYYFMKGGAKAYLDRI